eukprot:4461-Heterococcus_DN1.PRE.2
MNEDFLLAVQPAWFKALTCLYMLSMPNNNTTLTTSYSYAFIKGLNWIRLPTIIYATQSLTSVIPMMGEFIASDKLDTQAKIKLIAIYSPYFIIPLSMVLFLALDEYPFTQKPRLCEIRSLLNATSKPYHRAITDVKRSGKKCSCGNRQHSKPSHKECQRQNEQASGNHVKK